jgi:hypothetical protein
VIKSVNDGYLKKHIREQIIGVADIKIADILGFHTGSSFKSLSLSLDTQEEKTTFSNPFLQKQQNSND